MFSKEWWESSLVWIGILTAVGSASDLLVQFLQTHDFSIVAFIMLLQGLLVIWRRLKTDTAIKTGH